MAFLSDGRFVETARVLPENERTLEAQWCVHLHAYKVIIRAV